jgi:hypothetical protein
MIRSRVSIEGVDRQEIVALIFAHRLTSFLRSIGPATERLDPLRAFRGRDRKGEIEDRDPLPETPLPADGGDYPGIGKDDLLHGYVQAKHASLEGDLDLLFQHREKTGDLLRTIVAIDGSFRDELLEARLTQTLCFS